MLKFSALAALALTVIAAPALAAAPVVLDVAAPHGFAIRAATSADAAGALVAEGRICRRQTAAIRPYAMEIERISADGAVLATARAPVNGALGRSRGCGGFSVHTGWALSQGETLRMRALAR